MTIGEWCRYHAADNDNIVVVRHDETGKVVFGCVCEARFVRRTKSGLGIGLMHAEPDPQGLYELDTKGKFFLLAPDGAITVCDPPEEEVEL